MPKVFYNGSIQNFRGRISNLIIRQLPDGTTVVSEAPPKETGRRKKRAKEKRSERQKAHNEHFSESSAYAKQAAKENSIYAEIAATNPMWNAYNIALKDRLKPPVISRIERREGRILVEATDNLMVAKVSVTIFDEEKKIIEMGDAIRQEGDWWVFASNTPGKTIRAQAWDLANNVTKLTV
jgi:hypothetical protein